MCRYLLTFSGFRIAGSDHTLFGAAGQSALDAKRGMCYNKTIRRTEVQGYAFEAVVYRSDKVPV